MELVYLWVEDYKNIQKQGFNFSPNFECEFFPKYEEYINENGEKKEKLKENCELKITPKENPLKDFFPENINVTAIVGENGSGKSSIIEDFLSKTSEHIIMYIYENEFYVTSKKGIKCNVKYIKGGLIDFIHLNSDVLKTANVIDFRSFFDTTTYTSNLYIEKCIEGSNLEILNLDKFQQNIYKTIFKIFKEKIDLKFNFIPTRIILSFKNGILKEYSKEKYKFFEKLKKDHLNKGSIKENGYEIKNFINNYFEKNEELFFQFFEDETIGVMLYDELDRNIFHLSNGERKQFIDMILIYERLKEKNTNCLIFLDEPDLGIHPNWQKEYIKELINIFSNFGKKLHFIITSHSPFILSDLPKENIIFLEKGKQVYPFEDGKQTFGANIHTLLSHGFFMKDGLMGEFAKSKIDDVINYLNGKKSEIKNDNEAQNIINIMGEPIIKRELQRILNSKRLSKIDKIDVIEKQIEELQKELKKIKND